MDAPRVTLAIRGALAPRDLAALRAALRGLAAGGAAVVVVCDVSRATADAVLVDALGRLQLEARRRGCELRLENPRAELVQLIDLMGLSDVLPPA